MTCTFENTRIDAGLEIVKTGKRDVVHDGDNVIFTYDVSNPSSNNGSVSDVAVTDDKCSNVEGPVSKTGGNDDEFLDPGETWTYTCTTPALHVDEDTNHVITNVATATGKNPFGDPVSDTDDDTTKVIDAADAATTVLAQQVVLGERVTPGAARLLGPTGCQAKAFNARIRGSKIATVTFVLDGKVVKKVRNTKNAKLIQLRSNPKSLRIGVHRLVVNVTFQAGSNTSRRRSGCPPALWQEAGGSALHRLIGGRGNRRSAI